MHGPTCIFWAGLTPLSLEARALHNAGRAGGPLVCWAPVMARTSLTRLFKPTLPPTSDDRDEFLIRKHQKNPNYPP
jgi:hypothetical protein